MKSRFAAACVMLAGLFAVSCGRGAPDAATADCHTGSFGSLGGSISLQDAAGKAVTERDFAGTPTLLYFGYASCPDVCPMALQTARAALDARGSRPPQIRSALVTVDPERDTAEKLAQYVSTEAFPKGLVGLRGSDAQIKDAAHKFGVFFQKQPEPDSAMGYTVGHSSFFYLMDGQWRLKALFPSTMAPTAMAACIGKALTER